MLSGPPSGPQIPGYAATATFLDLGVWRAIAAHNVRYNPDNERI
jgi:hypothetical protein